VEICADWQFVANVTIQLDFYIYQLQSFKVSFSNYSCASRKGIILFGCCVVEESQKNCWLRVAVVKAGVSLQHRIYVLTNNQQPTSSLGEDSNKHIETVKWDRVFSFDPI
jgi:hypothetical protein